MPKKESKTQEKKPVKKKITQKEFEKKVVDLAKEGLTAEKIGEKLRQEGIHPMEFETKISKILKKENSYINPDLKNVEDKLKRVEIHLEKNAQDKRALRERSRLFSQVRKLKKYFK